MVRALLESRASPFVAYYGQVHIEHECMHGIIIGLETGAAGFSAHDSGLRTRELSLVPQAARVFDDWALHPAPRTTPGRSLRESVDLVSLRDTRTNL